jgi:hypothetical protein
VWLGDLVHRARAGADPDLELAVPDAVLDTGVHVPLCRKTEDGTIVTTLARALTLFHADHLLFPDDPEHSAEPVVIYEPGVALTLANTADMITVSGAHDPATVSELAGRLTGGQWDYRLVAAVRIDHEGRLIGGLNTLLAIVLANRPAPALTYDLTPDPAHQPLTWRGPADRGTLERR